MLDWCHHQGKMQARVSYNALITTEPASCRFRRLQTWLLAGLLSMVLLAGCANDMEKVQEFKREEQADAETGKDVEVEYSEMGMIKARVIAPTMVRAYGDDPYTEFPDGVTVYNYNDTMGLESTLTANYGINYENREEMLVRDNVVLVNAKGEKLNSEELNWNRKSKKVFSDKFVKVTTPEEIIEGNGFEADEDFSNYEVKDITGIFSVEADAVE